MKCVFYVLVAVGMVTASCVATPSTREMLMRDTAEYTQCGHVTVGCVDEECSNIKGGPWQAEACGTKYECSHHNGEVFCKPES